MAGGMLTPFDVYNGVWLPATFSATVPSSGVDVTSVWANLLVPGQITMRVRTEKVAGQWQLRVEFQKFGGGGALGSQSWTKTIATGFPPWGATEVLRRGPVLTWTYGGNISLDLRPMTYALLPPGFCTP